MLLKIMVISQSLSKFKERKSDMYLSDSRPIILIIFLKDQTMH